MTPLFRGGLLLILLLGTTSCSHDGPVEQFMTAYNNHDVDAMLALTTADVRWMSVTGKDIAIETGNQAELGTTLIGFFADRPHSRSRHRSIEYSDAFVYTLEEAYAASGKSQCSVGIYELRDQKIANVWYFPAHQCP